jgi:N-acetylmuramoyl-L-alanine amidase
MPKTRITSNIPADRIDFFRALAEAEGGQVSTLPEDDGEFTLVVQFPDVLSKTASVMGRAFGPMVGPALAEAAPPQPPAANMGAGLSRVDFPPWLTIAQAERSVREAPGSVDNARIMAYHASTDGGPEPDSVPWCSSFVNWCITQAGLQGTQSKRARSWLNWGVPVKTPEPGSIVVLERGKPPNGHVGFFVGIEAGRVLVLGGNQSDSVNVAAFPAERVIGLRLPSPDAIAAAGLGAVSSAAARRRHDVDILARTIWGEARGETPQGMEAVAAVIVNRARQGPTERFGNGIAGVCLEPMQFSCWNGADPNRPKVLAVTATDDRFGQCLRIAELAVDGKLQDPTHGSLHYHTAAVHPDWSAGHVPIVVIGAHLFFNDVA